MSIFFANTNNSYKFFVTRIEVTEFRNIKSLDISFEHPVTAITGVNKVGKTSLLLLIACSHYDFVKYDSTKPDTQRRRHTWKDVIPFTNHENSTRIYEYKLHWRVGHDLRMGTAKRLPTSKSWSGVGKASSDPKRRNAKIRDREVRLIDLERLLPARNFSNSLMRKIARFESVRLSPDVEQAFGYIFSIPGEVKISMIGSHVNKVAYLIEDSTSVYSSYNAATGEESVINILIDVFESSDNSLILIDELESGFHPVIQRRLADIIQYVAWHHKKQFIITTHSPSLLAAFPQASRKFLERNSNGGIDVKNKISVNAAFSKMDSDAYPLVYLYCEDEISEFIICEILNRISQDIPSFYKLINIIKSGPADQVRNDYLRHQKNYNQMKIKIGYCCVLDGDYRNDDRYAYLGEDQEEFGFFLYSDQAPEKFLISAFLDDNDSPELRSSL